jgi:hypothetical protein
MWERCSTLINIGAVITIVSWVLCPAPVTQVCFSSHSRLIGITRAGFPLCLLVLDITNGSSPCLLCVILLGPRANAVFIPQTTICSSCRPQYIEFLGNAALWFSALRARRITTRNIRFVSK